MPARLTGFLFYNHYYFYFFILNVIDMGLSIQTDHFIIALPMPLDVFLHLQFSGCTSQLWNKKYLPFPIFSCRKL